MKFFKRPPDFVIGPKDDPYLRRWWIIPRNRFFNIYLHHIRHSDDDMALHDHPWWNCSIVLSGCYVEVVPEKGFSHGVLRRLMRLPGSITFRRASAAHRLEVPDGVTAWTLFITGPVIREWGFHCPNGWVHWKDFVDESDTGAVGRGCGEHDVPRADKVVTIPHRGRIG